MTISKSPIIMVIQKTYMRSLLVPGFGGGTMPSPSNPIPIGGGAPNPDLLDIPPKGILPDIPILPKFP